MLAGFGAGGVRVDPWRPVPIGRRFELLLTGVGKANAAGAAARAIEPDRVSLVLNLGVAGVLPGAGLNLGDVVIATESVFADEGLLSPAGFQDVASMGFAPFPSGGVAAPGDPDVVSALSSIADGAGPIATVSTCSATDEQAQAIRSRTGALVEAMEGAAAGLAVARINRIAGARIPFAEARMVSNTTGDRTGQRWDLDRALARLADFAAQL